MLQLFVQCRRGSTLVLGKLRASSAGPRLSWSRHASAQPSSRHLSEPPAATFVREASLTVPPALTAELSGQPLANVISLATTWQSGRKLTVHSWQLQPSGPLMFNRDMTVRGLFQRQARVVLCEGLSSGAILQPASSETDSKGATGSLQLDRGQRSAVQQSEQSAGTS